MSRRRHWVALLLGGLAAGLLGACDARPRAADGPTPDDGGEGPADEAAGDGAGAGDGAASLVNLTLPPVATFADHCARCHGPEGMFYGSGFGDLSDAALHEVVDEMLVGPAGLDPTPGDVDAMTAYHRALAAGEPFVAVVNGVGADPADPASLELDHGPDAAVSRSGADGTVRITVRRNGATTELHFPEQQWSHAE